MSLHQDIIRAQIQHGATNLQDAYRIAWMAGIPWHLRKPEPQTEKPEEVAKRGKLTSIQNGLVSGAIRSERMKAERAAMADELRALIANGAPLSGAAQAMGITWVRAKKIAVENGIDLTRPPKPRIPVPCKKADRDAMDQRRQEVAAMVQSGKTNVEIYKTLGISRRSLEKTLAALGLRTGRSRADAVHADRKAQIIAMDQAGHSKRDIAARFGLSLNRVQKIIGGYA